jgi:hypothetical protein
MFKGYGTEEYLKKQTSTYISKYAKNMQYNISYLAS